jgi:hypothetical protein
MKAIVVMNAMDGRLAPLEAQFAQRDGGPLYEIWRVAAE